MSFDQENLEKIDSEDGITDTVLLVIKAVFNLINSNIKELDLPAKIKSGLKKLKKPSSTSKQQWHKQN